MINRTESGKVEPGLAGNLGYLANSLAKIIEGSDLEKRVNVLEKEIKQKGMNKTRENKITKLEREADRVAIVPPAELLPYFKGKKAETEEESQNVQQMHDEWLARIKRALDRESVPPQEILETFPEPFRTRVIEAIIKLKEKS